MIKNKGLGKGLNALIPEELSEKVLEDNKSTTIIKDIDINLIIPNKEQPRKHFDPEKLEILSDSIDQHGLLQPIVLKKKGGFFEIIAGERRWRACKNIGMDKIPAILKNVDDYTMAQLAIIENIQREDLNPIEEANAFKKLIEDHEVTQEVVSKIVGRSRAYITNSLRLLNLEPIVQESLENHVITIGHAKAILSLKNQSDQKIVFDHVVSAQESVRKTEELVKKVKKLGAGSLNQSKMNENMPKEKPNEIKALENTLSSYLGSKVAIKDQLGKGKLVIDYYSYEDLNRIIELIDEDSNDL